MVCLCCGVPDYVGGGCDVDVGGVFCFDGGEGLEGWVVSGGECGLCLGVAWEPECPGAGVGVPGGYGEDACGAVAVGELWVE